MQATQKSPDNEISAKVRLRSPKAHKLYEEIKQLLMAGESYTEIQSKLSVSAGRISILKKQLEDELVSGITALRDSSDPTNGSANLINAINSKSGANLIPVNLTVGQIKMLEEMITFYEPGELIEALEVFFEVAVMESGVDMMEIYKPEVENFWHLIKSFRTLQ